MLDQLSYEATQLRVGQFVGLICSRERTRWLFKMKWNECIFKVRVIDKREKWSCLADVMGSNSVGASWTFQVSITDNRLNCPDKCDDHFQSFLSSIITRTSNIHSVISFVYRMWPMKDNHGNRDAFIETRQMKERSTTKMRRTLRWFQFSCYHYQMIISTFDTDDKNSTICFCCYPFL